MVSRPSLNFDAGQETNVKRKVLLGTNEVWDAVSQEPIAAGQRVRVIRMILEVEQE